MSKKLRIARLEDRMKHDPNAHTPTRVILPSDDPEFVGVILTETGRQYLTQAEYDALPKGRVIVPPDDDGTGLPVDQ